MKNKEKEWLQKEVEDIGWPNPRKVQKWAPVMENRTPAINPGTSLFSCNLSLCTSFHGQGDGILWNVIKTEGVAQRSPGDTALWVALHMMMMIQPTFLSLLVIRSSPLMWWSGDSGLWLAVCHSPGIWVSPVHPPPHPRAFPDVFTFCSPLCRCVSMFLPSSEWNTQSLSCSLRVLLKTNYAPTLR